MPLEVNEPTSSFTIVNNKAQYTCNSSIASPLYLTSTASTVTVGQVYNVQLSIYENNNNMLGYVKLGNTLSPALTSVGTHNFTMSCTTNGYIRLYAEPNGNAGKIIFDNIIIALVEVAENVVSETKTFNINRCTSMYEPYRFAWLNQLGGFDQFTFDLVHTRKASIQRKEYSQTLGRLTTSTNWSYSVGDRNRTNTWVDSKDKYVVNSNWIDANCINWLQELYESLTVTQVKNIYNQSFASISNSGGYIKLSFISHSFKVGESVLLILNQQNYNTTYNGLSTVTAVTENSVTLSKSFANNSSNESGVLYLIPANHTTLPIIVTTTEWEEKQKANQKLINYTIEFERAYDRNLQRG